VFYALSGMSKKFKHYLTSEITILGKHVRPHSDYVTPNSAEGWDARCHIEGGKVWEIRDAATWQEVRP